MSDVKAVRVGSDQAIEFYSCGDLKLLGSCQASSTQIWDVAHIGGPLFVAGNYHSPFCVDVIDAESRSVVWKVLGPESLCNCVSRVRTPHSAVRGFSDFAVAGGNGSFYYFRPSSDLLDCPGFELVAQLSRPSSTAQCVDFVETRNCLVGTSGGEVLCFDLTTEALISTFVHQEGGMTLWRTTVDQKTPVIYSSGDNNWVHAWDLREGNTLPGASSIMSYNANEIVDNVFFQPENGLIATLLADGKFLLLDPRADLAPTKEFMVMSESSSNAFGLTRFDVEKELFLGSCHDGNVIVAFSAKSAKRLAKRDRGETWHIVAQGDAFEGCVFSRFERDDHLEERISFMRMFEFCQSAVLKIRIGELMPLIVFKWSLY